MSVDARRVHVNSIRKYVSASGKGTQFNLVRNTSQPGSLSGSGLARGGLLGYNSEQRVHLGAGEEAEVVEVDSAVGAGSGDDLELVMAVGEPVLPLSLGVLDDVLNVSLPRATGQVTILSHEIDQTAQGVKVGDSDAGLNLDTSHVVLLRTDCGSRSPAVGIESKGRLGDVSSRLCD